MAILLAGLFYFPLVFQSFHITRHHSESHHCEGHSCQAVSPESARDAVTIAKHESFCPVCDYRFAVKEAPSVAVHIATVLPVLSILEVPATRHACAQVPVTRSPRAPPAPGLQVSF